MSQFHISRRQEKEFTNDFIRKGRFSRASANGFCTTPDNNILRGPESGVARLCASHVSDRPSAAVDSWKSRKVVAGRQDDEPSLKRPNEASCSRSRTLASLDLDLGNFCDRSSVLLPHSETACPTSGRNHPGRQQVLDPLLALPWRLRWSQSILDIFESVSTISTMFPVQAVISPDTTDRSPLQQRRKKGTRTSQLISAAVLRYSRGKRLRMQV